MAIETVRHNKTVNRMTVDYAMHMLIEKASKSMTVEDFDGLSDSIETVIEEQTYYLSETVRNIANVITFDEKSGSLHGGEEAGRLLYVIAHNVEMIGVMGNLAANARWYSQRKTKGEYPFDK
jgi:hypothetical protein